VTANPNRLPLRVRAGYGTAELGMSAAEVMLQLLLFNFYTGAIGLRPELAGYALGLAILWDALVDPLMGTISDRTRLVFGRRRPYLLVGGAFLATMMCLLFTPPNLESQTSKFLYLFVCYTLANTSMTIINVPHSALGGELSFDRDERTELFGWRMLFKNFGFLFGAILPGALLGFNEGDPNAEFTANAQASLGVAVAIILSATVTVMAVGRYDRPSEAPPRTTGAAREVRDFFRGIVSVAFSPVFGPLLLGFVVAQIGRTINASLALQYYDVRLGIPESDVLVYIVGVLMVVMSISIIGWVLVSRKYGKKRPAFVGAVTFGILTSIGYLILPYGNLPMAVLFGAVLCGATVGSIVLFDSLVADVVDYDELKTRQHREGLYFGCWLMGQKLSRALGLSLTGILLSQTGYEENVAQQAEGVGWRIALLFGPGVGIWFIAAALIFLLMPLTDTRHRRVQALLRQRQERKARQQSA